MPTSITDLHPRVRALRWTPWSSASLSDPYELTDREGVHCSVAVTGTFGGATIVLQGSLDGTNWFTLNDRTNAAISLTAAGLREFLTTVRFIRPTVTGGTGTALTIDVIVRAATV